MKDDTRANKQKVKAKHFTGFATRVLTVLLYLALFLVLLGTVCFRSAEGMGLFGYRLLAVRTSSMSPTIPVGSLVLIGPVKAPISSGTVITYRTGGDLVTHRVVGIESEGVYVTRGDAVSQVDTTPVLSKDIVGSLRFSISLPNGLLFTITSPIGLVSVVGLAVVVLLIRWWYKFFVVRTHKASDIREKTKGESNDA